MANRNKKNILKNTFRRHSNGFLYGIIFLLATLITVGAVVSKNINTVTVKETKMVVQSVAVTKQPDQKVAATSQETTSEENTTIEETTTEEETTSLGTAKVTTETLMVRDEPSEDGEVIGQADQDQEFEILGKKGDWLKIDFDGQEGYINSEFVDISN